MSDSPPPPPPNDDKDWTWVLEEPCPQCGFVAATVDPNHVGSMLRTNIDQWVEILAGDEADVRARPDADTWSALEYACHVRDVYRIFNDRLALMLTEDGPHFPNWDQNATAIEERYDMAQATVVAPELRRAGQVLADAFDQVDGDQWQRSGYRSDGAAFTVASFARYFIHDPIHHVSDVTGNTEST